MPRYAFKVKYHGAPFVGWQRQKEHRSVQGAIGTALGNITSDMSGDVTQS